MRNKFTSPLLLDWFDKHKREFPFRLYPTPYRVWLSEVMSQQTTMATVLPYYEKFLKRFPDVNAVADTSEAEILTYWQGLGYYSRARYFYKACHKIVGELEGKFPISFLEWKKLPGIGDYTAAAIASICYQEKVPALDGNVIRVLTRFYAIDDRVDLPQVKRYLFTLASEIISAERPGDFNQAMMELGALVCKPHSPLCSDCPLQKNCASFGQEPEKRPFTKKMSCVNVDYAAFVVRKRGKILLRRPDDQSLVQGMWEIPGIYLPLQKKGSSVNFSKNNLPFKNFRRLGKVRHSITNRRIVTHVFHAETQSEKTDAAFEFKSKKEIENLPFGTLSRKILTIM